jgi:hypothetical protein
MTSVLIALYGTAFLTGAVVVWVVQLIDPIPRDSRLTKVMGIITVTIFGCLAAVITVATVATLIEAGLDPKVEQSFRLYHMCAATIVGCLFGALLLVPPAKRSKR